MTHEHMRLPIGHKRVFVDLGADRLIGAEKGLLKIALEIKSFLSESDIEDLENALGQYILYEKLLKRIEPDRILFLAVPQMAFEETFRIEVGEMLLADQTIRLVVFDPESEEIILWIPAWTIDKP